MTNQHRLHLFAFDVTHPPVPDQPVYGLRFSPSWREMIWPGRSEGCHVKTPGLASLREELMQLYPGLLYTRFDESALAGKRSEEHTSELQSRENIVCRLLLEKKNVNDINLSLLNVSL